MILTVIVNARAKTTKVISWRDSGTVNIAVAAMPVDGKANAALIKFLSKALKIPQLQIFIKRGKGAKAKHIELPDDVDLTLLK